jgi:hypothetical protein
MDLKDKTLLELKALAYDLLIQQEITSTNLRTVASEINARQQLDKKTPAESVSK